MKSPTRARVVPAKSLAQASGARGFVLVGVVMFVLALTILGISLFSLSSYEAQFYGRSSDDSQAFYSAMGGIERAKFVLTDKKTYESVKLSLPIGEAVYARARRVPPTGTASDTTGPVDFSGSVPIDIRVLAIHNGQRCMVESRFVPKKQVDYYKRLVTTYDRVKVVASFGGKQRDAQTFLAGEVWQNSSDISSWSGAGLAPILSQVGGVPHPDIAPYMTSHPTFIPVGAGNSTTPDYTYDLTAGTPGAVHCFKTSAGGASNSLWHTGGHPTVLVNGYTVWMLDKGVIFDDELTVQPQSPADPNNCLVLIVGTGSFSGFNVAAGFYGSITSTLVPIIISAEGHVELEHSANNDPGSSTVVYLSIFGGSVQFLGPRHSSPAKIMTMAHVPLVDPRDLPGGLIDRLYSLDALPNAPSSSITASPGAWRQVTASNPN